MKSTRPYAVPSGGLGLVLPPTSLAEIRLPSGANAPSPTRSNAQLELDDPHHNQNAIQHSPLCLAARNTATAILASQKEQSDSLTLQSISAFSSAVCALPTPHHLAPCLTPILPAALYLLSSPDIDNPIDARNHALMVLEHVIVHLCTQSYSKAQSTSAHLLRRSNWQLVLWDAFLDRVVLMDRVEMKDELYKIGVCLVGLMDLRADAKDKTGDEERMQEEAQERPVEWIDDWSQVVERVLKVLEMRPKMHADLRLEFTKLLTHLLSLTLPTLRLTYARRSITQLSLAIQWLSSARRNSPLQLLGVHALTHVQTLFLDPWSTPLPPPVGRQLPRLLAALVMASAGTLDVPTNVQDEAVTKVWAAVKERIQSEYVDQETWEADTGMVRQAISGMGQCLTSDTANRGEVSGIEVGVQELSV